jgi:two-component system response regulator FixJ
MKQMRSEPRLIYVVDDDEAVRHSLGLLLQSAGHKVELFEAAGDALAAINSRRPTCIVTDIRMPEIDGLEFQRRLNESRVDIPVIVITGHADVPLAVRAMKAGAIDFIEKPFSDDLILASIDSAMSKARDVADPEIGKRLDSLTPREREVLELLVVGHPNKVIAFRLDISARTVENHRARVMEKMQVSSLSELVRVTIRAGVAIPT